MHHGEDDIPVFLHLRPLLSLQRVLDRKLVQIERLHYVIVRPRFQPGDTIALDNGQIILNGTPMPREQEPPVQIPEDAQICGGTPCLSDFMQYRTVLASGKVIYEPPTYRETLPNGASYLVIDEQGSGRDNFDAITVPDGHVFLMGDNRDHSADSRFPANGELFTACLMLARYWQALLADRTRDRLSRRHHAKIRERGISAADLRISRQDMPELFLE